MESGGDKWIYRVVVGCLGLTVLGVVVGIMGLMLKLGADTQIPEALAMLGTTALGILGGVLGPLSGAKTTVAPTDEAKA